MKRTIRIILSVTVLCLFTSLVVQAQRHEGLVLDRDVKIDPQFRANIWSAVHRLADQGIPIGFEAGLHWNVDMGPRLKLKSGPLVDVLNSITEQDSSYAWREVDGVVNFFPVANRSKRAISFLNTRSARSLLQRAMTGLPPLKKSGSCSSTLAEKRFDSSRRLGSAILLVSTKSFVMKCIFQFRI
jgi:hypothetical protein